MKEDKKASKKNSVKNKQSTEVAEEKVFDVARPGETAPSSSSRPLIISHKPRVSSDPMVSPKSASNENEELEDKGAAENNKDVDQPEEAAEPILKAPKKNRIEPLNSIVADGEEKGDAETVEIVEDETAESSEEAGKSEPQEEKRDDTEDISNEIEDVSASVTTKKQAKEDEAKREKQEAEKRAEIEKLIENKHFFVSINSVQKRRSRRAIVVLGVLLIVVAGVLAAVDAELIDIGIEPFTDFL